ncbi:L-serine ammonia-lyase, iron-sulfur-dependent, subunit alpha [Clostridium omnivorum]|uniref:L-serine dehydratase n=1 Tax=Clostridium omnivorum TaxID=1604902 RepID=A0ABQ5N219_9CLOT|nr:L-serine ammonia-lyase, iron-sulfur-dependent, subunit alpha [Clostridium sp. E14]GLC29248.1 L-serine dehydratase, iron-sulfur-dependent subunit alpha [Clostridium sp. E14]
MFVNTAKELIDICSKENLTIWEYTLREEIKETGLDREEIWNKMKKNLKIMKEASEYGLRHKVTSVSGIIGGDAYRLQKYIVRDNSLCGNFMMKAMARAISCSEVNAAMGRIVATPTAGSCGVLPATVITAGEKLYKSEDELVQALFTAAGVGILIAKNATISGAEGGCQAEVGAASAMAAAATVEMMGGTVQMAFNAAAIVIKNILGLVCDPIAGLVEAPCAKRNASGTVSALTVADMAMAGVKSVIPFDEVVDAMYRVGKQLPCELRETALGGLATTPTGIEIRKKVLGQ